MKNNEIRTRILAIKNNTDLGEPINEYQIGEDTVSIYLVGKSTYFDALIARGYLQTWVFDPKGNEHVILVIEEYYNAYDLMFSEKIVKINVEYYKETNKMQKLGYIFSALSFLIPLLVFIIFALTLDDLMGILIGATLVLMLGLPFVVRLVFRFAIENDIH